MKPTFDRSVNPIYTIIYYAHQITTVPPTRICRPIYGPAPPRPMCAYKNKIPTKALTQFDIKVWIRNGFHKYCSCPSENNTLLFSTPKKAMFESLFSWCRFNDFIQQDALFVISESADSNFHHSDEEQRFMYRIDYSHLAVFCINTIWPEVPR